MDVVVKNKRYKLAALQGCPYVKTVLKAGFPEKAVLYDNSRKLIGTTIDGKRITSPTLIVGSLTGREVVKVGSKEIVKFLKSEVKKSAKSELGRVETEAIAQECKYRSEEKIKLCRAYGKDSKACKSLTARFREINGTIDEYACSIQAKEMAPLFKAYIGLFVQNPKAQPETILSPRVHTLFKKHVLQVEANKKFAEFLVELLERDDPNLFSTEQSRDTEMDQWLELEVNGIMDRIDFSGRPWILYHHVKNDIVMRNRFGGNLYNRSFWNIAIAKEMLADHTRKAKKAKRSKFGKPGDLAGPSLLMGGFGNLPGPGDTLYFSNGKLSRVRR